MCKCSSWALLCHVKSLSKIKMECLLCKKVEVCLLKPFILGLIWKAVKYWQRFTTDRVHKNNSFWEFLLTSQAFQTLGDLCVQPLMKKWLKCVWVSGSVWQEILKAPWLCNQNKNFCWSLYTQSGKMSDTPTSLASKNLLRYYDNKQLRWKGRKKNVVVTWDAGLKVEPPDDKAMNSFSSSSQCQSRATSQPKNKQKKTNKNLYHVYKYKLYGNKYLKVTESVRD